MALLRHIETIQSRLSEIPVKAGQIIFCTDTNDIFMDNSENDRTHMTDIIKLKTEKDRESLFVPLVGKIYLVEETNVLYKYNGVDWETISIDISINIENVPYSQLVPGTLQKKDQGYAPRTLGSVVYLEDGKTVNQAIAELKQLSIRPVITTLKNTVRIITDVNTVSIGIEGYNKSTDVLFVYVNSTYLEETQDYTIEGNSIKMVGDGVWNGSVEPRTFNFVVLKLSVPEAITTFAEKIVEPKIESDTVSQPEIPEDIVQKMNSYESTISSLLEKINSIESQLQNINANTGEIVHDPDLENRVYSNEGNISSLVDRVVVLENTLAKGTITVSEEIESRVSNLESGVLNLESRVSNVELK